MHGNQPKDKNKGDFAVFHAVRVGRYWLAAVKDGDEEKKSLRNGQSIEKASFKTQLGQAAG